MADGAASTSADTKLASDVADMSLENPTETSKAADDLASEGDEDGDEDEGEDEDDGAVADGAAAGSASSKKKRKPRKKKKKKATSTDPAASESALAKEPQQNGPAVVHDIPSLLQQLAMSQPQKKEGKAPEDYKFWNTQPVPRFKEPNLLQTTSGGEGETLPEGPILPNQVCQASAKPEPEKLVDGFEWCLIDLDNKEELQEFYDLLYNHYVEDTDGSFRFNYSPEFLKWALKPPGYKKEWHIGVRTKSTGEGKKGKLVASITGIPVTLKVRGQKFDASEINFLAIHRKLRNKRLAPVLIKEVTRRCYLNGIYQALYTAGTLLPTPISTCRYFHRSLDWEHLYNTGFSHMPPGSSALRQKYKYKLESHTQTKGLRPMKPADVQGVKDLLVRYSERFHLRQEWTEEEVLHFLCSDVSKSVVTSYVVEEGDKITDFISYYLLESSVLRSQKRENIRAAYLYYYATEAAFPGNPKPKANDAQDALQARLQTLVHDALILAAKDGFHVFNALTLLDNPLFLKEQKFEPGDGKLHFYLFNWRTALLPGGIDHRNQIDTTKMGGVGIVML
ncbi:Glycylpeptide N-tetradecanoyltransferase [Lecanosticta acicola]|uniref:Glycylpeptide N-tetradecanoyltransferase n=1 Tax=Lecanosticta acicola TaxID=111012 RepID=A0AAI8Z6Z7_9PEZI|nr:Glycylpeptide N-tetradecanoyltransferase [Lecanosticta acicola]